MLNKPQTTPMKLAVLVVTVFIILMSYQLGYYFGKFPVMENTRVVHVDKSAPVFGSYIGKCKFWHDEEFCAVDNREAIIGDAND